MRQSSASTITSRSAWRVAPALLLSLAIAAATPVAAAPPVPAANAAVITTWNQIAVSTVTAGGASPTNFNYFAFVHLAMYNAVVGITGEYELYRWTMPAPHSASPEAAAAAAAHRVLTTYFPAATATLDAHLATSLALVPDAGPRESGINYGRRAADHIIALRANDGRNAAVTVPDPTQPGDWRPTPPAEAPFASAWLGGVTPLAIESATQFAPGPPPAINGDPDVAAAYLEEFNEVRITGDIDAPVTDRSDDMEQTAKFFSDAGIGPMQAALRLFATQNALDIDDSARMFAAVDTSIADGAITVWHAKFQYMWWRPVTAIRMADTDGNDLTVGDSDWTPLIITPPYPDWPSGLCSVVGAVSTALTRLNGNGMLNLTIMSPTAGETRTFATASEIAGSAVDARVWSGIHFRTADEVSIIIGTSVANYVLDNYFQPTD
jgi:hypothetical protein